MQPHEVAVLRRSLAMADMPVDRDTLARVLLTCEELNHERAQLRALLLEARGTSVVRLRQIVGRMRAVLGE